MKIKKMVVALTLVAVVGIGGTAYAATANTNQKTQIENGNHRGNGLGMKRSIGIKGRDIVDSVAKDKFKISEAEITKARQEGKTLYDLLKEKGISHEDFKAANIEAKNKAIDDAVSNGKLTKEDGEKLKTAIKEKSANAVPGQGKMNGGKGQGGKRGANCIEQ